MDLHLIDDDVQQWLLFVIWFLIFVQFNCQF